MERRRVTVKEASELLGVSEHAIRQRIRRDTLESHKDAEGRVYVWIDADAKPSGEPSGETSDGHHDEEFIRMLREQNELLREQLDEAHAANRENRRIIAGLVQRVPELERTGEAPPEPRESPVTASEEPSGTTAQRPPWWRRIFGLPRERRPPL
ncbi:MAG: hypothetical protein JOZ57_03765 [Abitibacteriaceae bacterium]|nr:hypothetical protein [Abditibacteriaceae bacterium]